MLDRFPNVHVEIGARIGETRPPAAHAARFFDKYQDRILFGTDAIPHGTEMPQQVFGDALYGSTTASSRPRTNTSTTRRRAVPPQGRWRIYGLGLPDTSCARCTTRTPSAYLG